MQYNEIIKNTSAVILAGGRGSRLDGRDKGLISIAGQPMIEHLLKQLHEQIPRIIISANRNIERYQAYNLPVIMDEERDYAGPLAGISAAMQAVSSEYLLTLPCDAPVIAHDYLKRMATALCQKPADIAIATDGNSLQYIHTLIPVRLHQHLQKHLQAGHHRVGEWLRQNSFTEVDFSDQAEAFHNMNTEADRLKLVEQSAPDCHL
ncbi:MAG: molybdenum cofactor guanylyltransferase MobA [Gammaproteobacteria bacterium]